jgi:hypothetical protein
MKFNFRKLAEISIARHDNKEIDARDVPLDWKIR